MRLAAAPASASSGTRPWITTVAKLTGRNQWVARLRTGSGLFSNLITRAIESLWDVARRKYVGEPGSILYITKDAVEVAIYGPVREAMNLLKRSTSELIKQKPDGEVDGTDHGMKSYEIPDDFQPAGGFHLTDSRRVDLPVRQQDKKIYSTSSMAYLPLVPKGFQQG